MLVGCAQYIEILKVPSVLSLTLQCENLDIVGGINAILKPVKTLMSLSKQDPLQWPEIKLLTSKVSIDGTQGTHQGCVLNWYSADTLQQCVTHAKADLD